MSTELTATQQKLAARRENMASRLEGLGGGAGLAPIRLSNRSFVLPPDDTIVKNTLEVIVLDWALNYTYYDKPYVKGETSFPVCFAVGQSVNNMAPSDNSSDKQNDICATCPQNQFGSGAGNAKACQNRINLAVQIADHGPESPMYRVSVSPTALKNWRQFASALDERGVLPVQVVTRLSFDQNAAYDRLTFAASRKTDKDELQEYVNNMDRATELLLTEPKPPAEDDEA